MWISQIEMEIYLKLMFENTWNLYVKSHMPGVCNIVSLFLWMFSSKYDFPYDLYQLVCLGLVSKSIVSLTISILHLLGLDSQNSTNFSFRGKLRFYFSSVLTFRYIVWYLFCLDNVLYCKSMSASFRFGIEDFRLYLY